MTSRPDRTLIERAFLSEEKPAVIALRFRTTVGSVKSIWKRAKDDGRLPKIARKIGKGRRSA